MLAQQAPLRFNVNQVIQTGGVIGASDIGTSMVGCRCMNCTRLVLWVDDVMVVPAGATPGPLPHADMPENVRVVYEEARTIATESPRAAAALLRVSLEALLKHLDGGSGTLDDLIARQVLDGMPVAIQQSMDVLRVAGNDRLHEVRDDESPADVASLFELINLVVDNRITQPAKIRELYERLPEEKRAYIEKRDGRDS